MDLIIPFDADLVLVDLTIVAPLARTRLGKQGSSADANWYKDAEDGKLHRYKNLADKFKATMIPFVVSTDGQLAPRAEAFIKRLSKAGQRSGHSRSLHDHIRETLIENIFPWSDVMTSAHDDVASNKYSHLARHNKALFNEIAEEPQVGGCSPSGT